VGILPRSPFCKIVKATLELLCILYAVPAILIPSNSMGLGLANNADVEKTQVRQAVSGKCHRKSGVALHPKTHGDPHVAGSGDEQWH
jgi:hypothetical protein